MTPPGGAAALHGFLFQILRTAEWALRIDLCAPEKNETNVTIIAEPPAGDVDIRFTRSRLVQQFKVRDKGKWNLAAVVDDVLPDLYGAIHDTQQNVQYEFVSNSGIGQWTPAYDFFRSLASRTPAADPLDSLDATDKRFRLRRRLHTERSLFEEIILVLRKHKRAKEEDEITTRRHLWHLCSRFEFVPTGNLRQARQEVRRLLATYVVDDAKVDDQVARLLTTVLHYAAEGNRSFRPADLFHDAGIEGVAFTRLPLVRKTIRELATRDMRRLLDYDRSLSVRKPLQWPTGSRILVLSGESGQGKSWSLADLAHDVMEKGGDTAVAFTRAGGNFLQDLTAATQRVVRDGLGHNTSAPFEQLAKKIRETLPDLSDPWLTVCLDDIRSAQEIQELCDAPLDEWKIRVAMTVGPRLAKQDGLRRRGAVIKPVSDFSETELRLFLLRHGRQWAEIPPTVRRIMRRPLLATMFVRDSKRWSPKTEYELCDAWWRRLSVDREQPEYPDDVAAMLTLAQDFVDGGTYPWSRRKLRALQIDSAQQIRLESVGWLRADDDGAAAIWHDRLLNWAVAETVAENVRELVGDPQAITDILQQFPDDPELHDGQRPRLPDVPRDVLWMCASREVLPSEQLDVIIHNLAPRDFNAARLFYGDLSRVGSSIIPALMNRLRSAEEDADAHGIERNVGDAIAAALETADADAPTHIFALLQDPSPQLRDIGIRAARRHPAASYVPILWNLLVQHDAEKTQSPGSDIWSSHAHWRRERLFNALAPSVACTSSWLRQTAAELGRSDPYAVTLAWLLSKNVQAEGRALWQELKNKLIASTPPEKPGGLIACIHHFMDFEEVARLEDWLTSPHDFASAASLGALAILAPEKALEFARTGNHATVSSFSSWWVPWLMLVQRNQTLAVMRERLTRDPSVADWLRHEEHELDAATTEAVAKHLSGEIQAYLDGSTMQWRFSKGAALLRAGGHVVVIDALRRLAGSEFERRLVAAIGRLPLRETILLSEASADLRVILRRMHDAVAAEALADTLSRDDATAAEIDRAIAYPTGRIRDELRAYVDRHAKKWDKTSLSQTLRRAVRALAAIGDDDGVVDAVWTFGPNVIDDDVPWLVGDREPMRGELVERLLDALGSNDDERWRAVGGLRISRRSDLVPLLLKHAAAPQLSAGIRYQGIRAARDLVQPRTEVADMARGLVEGDCDDERHVLADLLIASGTPASMDLLAVLARKLPFNHVADMAILEHLVDDSERGREMAAILQTHLLPFPYAWALRDDTDAWKRLFPIIANDELRQQALDSALIENPSIDWLMLIECVATFDTDAAFDLVLSALKTNHKGREILPPYLLRFNRNRLVEALTTYMPDEPAAVVRWSIARVLRWSGDTSLADRIREMAGSSSPAIRETAYDSSGWRLDLLTDHDLRIASLNDEHPNVRVAARDALRRRCRLRQTSELRDRLIASSGSQAWMYAEELTGYADPHLLGKSDDELCIWTALENHSRALRVQVETWLERRAKGALREAESEDFLRSRNDR